MTSFINDIFVSSDTVLFWFRRDLRLTDNAGLYHALRDHTNVQCLFIFDTTILSKLEDNADARVSFIHEHVDHLKDALEEHGSSLLIAQGDPLTIFKDLQSKAVYANHDYEPYARQRDEAVRKMLVENGGVLKTFKDQVIFEKDEVVKDNGDPYNVFTPYSKKWKALCTSFYKKNYPTQRYLHHLKQIKPLSQISISQLGFTETTIALPPRIVKKAIIHSYDKTRNFPGIDGTSRLGVHLRFGTVSIRQLVQIAYKQNATWLNELIWREFYMMILWHYPKVVHRAFKPVYDLIEWRNDPQEFNAWCTGNTGYPIVDAGMRELNETGFMHNRVRMITASFLTKHLLIDWRWGEAYFARKLLDYDLAANNGGWQWCAGSGCDAAPYFRVFNPTLQTEKFDKQHAYIKRWVPEANSDTYVKPIVEHRAARERVLSVYKAALDKNK